MAVRYPLAWVKLARFCELSGYTRNAVHAKMRRGVWADGIHYRRAPDGHVMINLEAYDAWVQSAA